MRVYVDIWFVVWWFDAVIWCRLLFNQTYNRWRITFIETPINEIFLNYKLGLEAKIPQAFQVICQGLGREKIQDTWKKSELRRGGSGEDASKELTKA